MVNMIKQEASKPLEEMAVNNLYVYYINRKKLFPKFKYVCHVWYNGEDVTHTDYY